MEINISKNVLVKGLQQMQSIVEKRNTMPILANTLIQTGSGQIELYATDLEVGIKEKIDAEVKSDGSITVSAKKIFEIVKELPAEELKIKKLDNNWVEISSGKAVFNLVGINPEDFPSFSPYADAEFMNIEINTLKEMIERTIVAISLDETRYNLNGAFFEKTEDNIIRMVSTDGHRLAVTESRLDNQDVKLKPEGYIIPRKGLHEFKKIIEDKVGLVELAFQDTIAILKKDNIVMVVRLIEGEFPDYKPVLPPEKDNVVKIDRIAFIQSLRRVSILSDEKTRGVKFEFAGNSLVISTTNPGFGEAKEELDIDYDGKEITAGFSARYILDFLNVMENETVFMQITDELSATLLKDGNNENFKAVVMPMRTA